MTNRPQRLLEASPTVAPDAPSYGRGLPWWRSQRTALTMVFVVIALAFGANEYGHVSGAYREAESRTLAAHAETAASLATAAEHFVSRYTVIAQTVAQAILLQPLPGGERRRLLATIRRAHPEIEAIAVTDPTGRVTQADPAAAVGDDLSARYPAVMSGSATAVGELASSGVGVAAAVRADTGELRGVVALRLPAPVLTANLQPHLAGGAHVLVVDPTGRAVVHGLDADVRREAHTYASVPLVRAALEGQVARGRFASPIDGTPMLGAMAPVPKLGWAAGVVQSEASALAPAAAAREAALLKSLTGLVAAVLLAVVLGTTLARPVVALAEGVAAIARGDLSHRVPVGSRNEFGQLARHFNAMAERLEEARRREQARVREARLSELRTAFLAEASKRLDASLDYEATLRSLARLVVPVLADGCLIDLTETGRAVHPVALAHVDPGREPLLREIQGLPVDPDGSHPVAVALRTGESQLASEVDEAWLGSIASNAAHRDLLRRLAPRSFMAVPLVARGRTLGVVSLFSIDSERRYGPADVAFAEDLAQRAAFAVDNARLFREAQQAIRQAQAAIRSRDSFLARASHELRTPLTSALGTIRLLRRSLAGALRETPETLVAIASRNLESMLDLINDLLDASKLAAGRERLSLAPVDLADIVGASAEILGAQARDKGVDLRVTVPAGLSLSADRLKLEQLFTNLLSNAVKFTPPGGQVAVEALADGGRVLVRVRDTGEGVATEHLEAIFEPFFQGDETRGRRPRGTGLGLAICRQIVTLHRGTIWAESEGPGRGSTFVVSLPAAIPEGRAA